MKRKQRLLLIITGLILVGTIVAIAIFNKSQNFQSTETTEVNALLKQAAVQPINNWKLYPRCGPTDAPLGGYELQVNNKPITAQQSIKLKSVAQDRKMTINARDDGYTIEKGSWNIIVLDKREPVDIFVSVTLKDKPSEFKEVDGFCG